MSEQEMGTLNLIRLLSKESQTGLLFSYKALKMFDFDYKKALDYLQSDEFKKTILY